MLLPSRHLRGFTLSVLFLAFCVGSLLSDMKRTGVSCKSKSTIGNRLGPSTSASTGPSRRGERLANARALRHAEIAGKLSASIVELCLIIMKKR